MTTLMTIAIAYLVWRVVLRGQISGQLRELRTILQTTNEGRQKRQRGTC